MTISASIQETILEVIRKEYAWEMLEGIVGKIIQGVSEGISD